ncbi:MAG: DUF3887 domain-containing protein [Anaerolineales bacterium]|jgi:hypothetical protein
MKVNSKFLPVSILIVVLLAGLSGCLPAKKAGLSDQQVASVTENILKALDQNNYLAFIHDFSPQMKSAFTQAKFSQLQTMLYNASGNFLYMDEPTITNNQGYAIYRFPSKYADETVTVTITFVIGGQEVEGLYFDSANLRKASQ